jgi:hypothetical protein
MLSFFPGAAPLRDSGESRPSFQRGPCSRPEGTIQASEFSVTAERINRVLVRITRSFLSLTHPEIDSALLDFHVTQIHQFKPGAIVASGVEDNFRSDAPVIHQFRLNHCPISTALAPLETVQDTAQ